MTGHNPLSSISTHSPASQTDLRPGRRLIVLISDDTDYSDAGRKILELAKTHKRQVLFLGLCKDKSLESSLRRQLATLAAIVADDTVSATTRIHFKGDWLNLIKSSRGEGDMIVCFSGQRTGFMQRPLHQILESDLKMPVYLLSLHHSGENNRPGRVSEIAAWAGSIGILAGFGWMQIRMNRVADIPAYIIMLSLSVVIEIWLIWVWNSFFN